MPKLFFCIYSFLCVQLERDIQFLKKFGKRLKQLRKEKKISQSQLSFEANIQVSQISRIERGVINTTIANVNLIATVLDVPLEEFFKFEE